jgi:hypothetical protein
LGIRLGGFWYWRGSWGGNREGSGSWKEEVAVVEWSFGDGETLLLFYYTVYIYHFIVANNKEIPKSTLAFTLTTICIIKSLLI